MICRICETDIDVALTVRVKSRGGVRDADICFDCVAEIGRLIPKLGRRLSDPERKSDDPEGIALVTELLAGQVEDERS